MPHKKKNFYACGIIFFFILSWDSFFPTHAASSSSISWEDPSLTFGDTPIRAIHIRQLRNTIDNIRQQCAIPGYPWTDPTLIAGTTIVRVVHLTELRNAVNEIYSAPPSRSLPRFIENITTATPIRASHIIELRNAVERATCCGDGDCNQSSENINTCPRDCDCLYNNRWRDLYSYCGGSAGTFTCSNTERLQYRDPTNNPLCPRVYRCVESLRNCCTQYGPYEDLGFQCGYGNCSPSQKLMLKRALESGCTDQSVCVTDNSCCSYTNWQNQGACGDDGVTVQCQPWQHLQTRQANFPSCPDPTEQCVADTVCCGASPWINGQCGESTCRPYQLYQYRTITYDVPECRPTTRCIDNNLCCGYPADYTNGSCGENCGGQRCTSSDLCQYKIPQNQGGDCDNIYRCAKNNPLCLSCSVGQTQSGTNSVGCSCIKNCNSVTLTWGPCEPNDPSCINCAVGQTQSGTNSLGCSCIQECDPSTLTWGPCVADYPVCQPGTADTSNFCQAGSKRYCSICGTDWSSCSCKLGETLNCITSDGCNGVQTCVAGNWQNCTSLNPVCLPGNEATCSGTDGLPGRQYCNLCGDGWSSCSCITGATIPCVNANGAAGERHCSTGGWWGDCQVTP